MRRPAGFDRPAQPPSEPGRARNPKQSAQRKTKLKPTSKPDPVSPPSKSFDPSDTVTEPIVLARVETSVSPHTGGLGQGSSAAANSVQKAAPGPEVHTAGATPVRRGTDSSSSAEVLGGTNGARAARSVLRAAGRTRKRFERAEVRRFTGRSRRRRTLWIFGVGSVIVAFSFIIGAAYSPLMALRTIEVVGTSRILASDVSNALADQIGTPLPLIDTAGVRNELSQFTLIQTYVTESRPPDTLVVRIVERVPVGVLATPNGFDLVDAAGVVIETTPKRTQGYPLIAIAAGVDSAGFRAAAAVLAVLPESIRTQLDSVTAASTDDVTLSLLGGERVVWGSPGQSEYKAVVLAALLVGHPAGTVNEYDVSSPDSAVLR